MASTVGAAGRELVDVAESAVATLPDGELTRSGTGSPGERAEASQTADSAASAQSATTTLGPCDVGWVAPTPTAVPVTSVPITVASTTDDYFVLYVTHERRSGEFTDIAVSVTLGESGTTTLADNLAPLDADKYQVEKYSVASPADIDGDCIDDITELNDLGNLNPINPATEMAPKMGTTAIDSHETFEKLSYKGKHVSIDLHLENLEFVKFWLLHMKDGTPEVYFMNTNTHRTHWTFSWKMGWTTAKRNGHMRGEIVYHPNVAAPDGSLGVYRYEFEPWDRYNFEDVAYSYEVLAAAMPVLENNLSYYPMPGSLNLYKKQKSKYDASRVNILLAEDVISDAKYIPFNEAEGYGLLREIEPGEVPGARDVVILKALPNDLPRVAGIITTVPQTPLSHVNLRAIQNGAPNAFIRDALDDDDIDDLIDSHVYYKTAANSYTLRAASKAEVDAWHDSTRPAASQIPQRDLSVQAITALGDVGFDDWDAFGVKAANVAELSGLSALADGVAPDGFAVPFYFYDEFMKQATFAKATVLGKKSAPAAEKVELAAGTTPAAAVSAMLANSHFRTDFAIQEEMLDDLRKAIKNATTPAWIITALEDMHDSFPDGTSLRYRSSTNNEDLPDFNGAGLYDSKTQDPDETAEDGIDKSIKGVWASLWNFRAFLEREHHRIDHGATAMGVLVHPNYSDELANGVAVSFDPVTGVDDHYYVNTQLGEDLVTNPDANSVPEQVLLDSAGKAIVLARSNLVPSSELLMSDAQMVELRTSLKAIHDHFAALYGVADGDEFAMEIEFKITADDKLAIKQARPWVFSEPLSLTPTVTVAFDAAEAAEGTPLLLTLTRVAGVRANPLTVDLTWTETGDTLDGTPPAQVTFPADEATVTISVPTADDTDNEKNSTVTAALAPSDDYDNGNPATATITVNDDDLPSVAVSADAVSVAEGDDAVFTLTRTAGDTAQALTVDITISETGTTLVAPPPTAVTLAAGETSATLTMATSDDGTPEPDSVVTVAIDPSSDYDNGNPATATVTDDDRSTVAISADVASVVEGGDAVFTLTRTGGNIAVALTVDVAVSENGATLAAGPPASVTFAANAASATLAVATIDDSTPENDSIVTVAIGEGGDYDVAAPGTAAATVIDNEPGPEIRLPSEHAYEGGKAHVVVLRNSKPTGTLTWSVTGPDSGHFRLYGDSGLLLFERQSYKTPADADADGVYEITLAATDDAGTTNLAMSFTVTHRDLHRAALLWWDPLSLDDRALALPETKRSLLEPVFASLEAHIKALVLRVTRQDPQRLALPPVPEISIVAGGDVTEGGDATFTLTASPAPAAALDVAVSVAQIGDFGVTAGSRTVTVATTGTGTLTVATTGDSTDEADGSVTATVADGVDYDVSTTSGSASVAVEDDDDPPPPPPSCTPNLPSDAVTVSEVTGWRDGHSGAAHVLRWNRVLEALGTDTGTGAAAMTATESEANEGLFMASRWDRVTRTLEAIAACDDPPPPPPPEPEISIAGGAGVTEGGSAGFTLSASPAPSAVLTVDVTVARQGDFGVSTGSRQVTISTAGTGSLSVATTDDSVDEPDGSVTVAVAVGNGYAVSSTAASATVAVSDDDDPPPPSCTPNLPGDAVTVSEVIGWRDGHSGAAHVLRWNRVLEALGEDTGTGAAAMTATESEANESLFMFSRWDRVTRTLEALEACDSPPPPPPPEPEISIAAGNGVTEGGSAGFTLTASPAPTAPLTASPAPTAPLTVDVTVAQQGDFGVSTGSRQVTISTAGTGSLSVLTSGDSVDEPDGSVTVSVDDGSGYTVSSTAGSASVAVSDDDDPPPPPPSEPEISIAAGNGVTEGDGAEFTLSASPPPASPLTVDVTVAQAGDFGATTGSRQVVISTSGTGTLTVTTSDDSVDEPDGSVTVTVDGGAGYTVSTAAGTASVAVSDDDSAQARLPPSQVSFSAEDASATEGGELRFRVMLSAAANARVRVYWRTRYFYGGEDSECPGCVSAFPDRDYPSRARGWLAFDPGDTEKWVEIDLLPKDGVAESNEVFLIYLSFTEGGATIADRDAVMTIHDND